jgi:hypothetical protein
MLGVQDVYFEVQGYRERGGNRWRCCFFSAIPARWRTHFFARRARREASTRPARTRPEHGARSSAREVVNLSASRD